MAKIITIGAAVQDVFLSHSPALAPVCESPERCFQRLELGSKIDVNQIHFSTGGGATNAAVTFARQGHQTQFMGVVGRDPAGQAVLDALDSESVGTQLVKFSDKYNTGYSVMLLAPNGERTILTYRGASTHYHPSDFSLENVQADWLYVSNLAGQMQTLSKLFTQARERGIKICFNPGKKELAQRELLLGLLQDVDILTVNKEEMQQLVEGSDLESLIRHGLYLVPTLLVTDGANGSMASDGKTIVRAGMYEDVPAVDRTGAGDAFASGFLSRWAEGGSLRDSVIFASANSSAVVAKISAKAGILHKGARLHEMPLQERSI
jgi:pfkB family kinase